MSTDNKPEIGVPYLDDDPEVRAAEAKHRADAEARKNQPKPQRFYVCPSCHTSFCSEPLTNEQIPDCAGTELRPHEARRMIPAKPGRTLEQTVSEERQGGLK